MSSDNPVSSGRPTKKTRQEHAREQAALRREQERRRKRRQRWLVQGGVIVGMLVVVAIVALVVVNANRPAGPGPLNMASDGILLTGNGNAITAVDTPATESGATPAPTDPTKHGDTANIVIYVDYQCPYCQQFETANAGQIEQLVTAGVATLEVHPLAILDNSSQGTKYSTRAANAAACVANFEPDKYLEVNNALFAGQPKEGTSGLTDTELQSLVTNAGATNKDIPSCITDQTFSSWVGAATKRALAGPLPNTSVAAVTGTPTVLVNGAQYKGSLTDASAFNAFVKENA